MSQEQGEMEAYTASLASAIGSRLFVTQLPEGTLLLDMQSTNPIFSLCMKHGKMGALYICELTHKVIMDFMVEDAGISPTSTPTGNSCACFALACRW